MAWAWRSCQNVAVLSEESVKSPEEPLEPFSSHARIGGALEGAHAEPVAVILYVPDSKPELPLLPIELLEPCLASGTVRKVDRLSSQSESTASPRE